MYNYKILFKYLCIFIFVTFFTNLNAQTGLNFQGVARNSSNVIISSQDITLRLSIVQGSVTGNTEYVEVRKVKTNAQGLFTTIIGDKETISTIGKFSDIDWKLIPKFLKIELDPTAGNNFITMGTTEFQYVAYAMFANSVLAENISGIVPVARGGTGSNSLTTFKSSLALDKVSNTADSLKPISKPTQSVLDLKLNFADSTKVFVTPTQLSKINFSSGAVSVDTTSISNRINLKLNHSDTAALLRKSDTTNIYNRINLKLNQTDTSNIFNRINLKLNQTDTSTLSNRINFKLNIVDTASLMRKTQVGVKNGAASLDSAGKIPSGQLPAISFSSVDVVKSQNEMLSLPITRVVGSIAVRLDSNKNFVLANLPATNRSNWVELINPDAPVQTVNSKSGNVLLTRADFPNELDKVDNTSDLNKPVSIATKDSLNTRLNIKDTSLLLQKVDTAAILAMYAKKFTKDVVVNFGIGGSIGKYVYGQTIPAKGKTLDEFLYDIVTKATPPTYSAPSGNITANPNFGSYEIGYNLGEITLSYTYNKYDAGDINSRIYTIGSTPLTTLSNGTAKITPGALLNTTTYGVTVNYIDGPIKNNTVNEPDPTGQIKAGALTSSNSFSVYSRRYWGAITEPFGSSTITSTTMSKINQDNNGTSSSFTVNFTEPDETKYLYFAYPNASGNLNSIILNGTERKASFTKSTIDLVNDQGYKQSYNIYTSIKRYWGTINSPFDPLTTLDIRTITPKFQDNFGGNTITNLSFTNDNTKFLYFAYPDNLADVTSFIYNGTESIRSFKKTVVNFQNERGTTPYKVYTSIKRYWGLTNQPFDPNTILDIRTLNPAAFQDNAGGSNYLNLTLEVKDRKYIYFAFPDGIGNADLKSFTIDGGFNQINAFVKSYINIQNDQGIQRYVVYTSVYSYEPDETVGPVLQIKNWEFK
jgi:hypothetical protein